MVGCRAGPGVLSASGLGRAVAGYDADLVLQQDFATCGERALDAERPPLDDHGL
jgi:hypothetical protein